MATPRYRRVLLKLSGEALVGGGDFGLDKPTVDRISGDIAAVRKLGVEVGIVIGGGNLFRGATISEAGIERATADQIGMLATVVNALFLQATLERLGTPARVLSAVPIGAVCELFVRRRALRHLEKGRVVLFAGGTGNPFFTTDTAAALRAVETDCEVLAKGTQVDGVYSADPKLNPQAERYERLSYQQVVAEDLKVMDTAAVTLARDNRLPILVFSIHLPGSFPGVVCGEGRYTLVS